MLKKVLLASLLLVATNAQAANQEPNYADTAATVATYVFGGVSARNAWKNLEDKSGSEIVKMMKEACGTVNEQTPDNETSDAKTAREAKNKAIKEAKAKIEKDYEALKSKTADKVTFTDKANTCKKELAISSVATATEIATLALLAKKAVSIIRAEDKKEAAKAAFDPRASKANKGFAALFAVAVASKVADIALAPEAK
jgi:L-lactate utilization protein LutC